MPSHPTVAQSRFSFVLAAILAALVLSLSVSASAYGAKRVKSSAKKKVRANRVVNPSIPDLPRPPVVSYGPSMSDLAVAPALPPSQSLSATGENGLSRKIINLRVHPIPFVSMLTDKTMLFAGRVDLDFLVTDRFSFGPSIHYSKTSEPDQYLAGQLVNESMLELGMLASVYLTGTTSQGGFLFRPHFYWTDVQGEKQGTDGSTTSATSTSAGMRTGAELIYQKVLANGFNFEVGGGFTYHMVRYQLDYPGAGVTHSEPASAFAPSVSLAIGWAF
jgi:hypothetical protein